MSVLLKSLKDEPLNGSEGQKRQMNDWIKMMQTKINKEMAESIMYYCVLNEFSDRLIKLENRCGKDIDTSIFNILDSLVKDFEEVKNRLKDLSVVGLEGLLH